MKKVIGIFAAIIILAGILFGVFVAVSWAQPFQMTQDGQAVLNGGSGYIFGDDRGFELSHNEYKISISTLTDVHLYWPDGSEEILPVGTEVTSSVIFYEENDKLYFGADGLNTIFRRYTGNENINAIAVSPAIGSDLFLVTIKAPFSEPFMFSATVPSFAVTGVVISKAVIEV